MDKINGKPSVLVLATLQTKAEEAEYLTRHLAEHGVVAATIDTSLQGNGTVLDGEEKSQAIAEAVTRTTEKVAAAVEQGIDAVVGIGGGTGSEIILKILRSLPITFPKILITTLPFDPRIAVADNSIVLVPTLADICGLNATLREVLENAAAMTAGLCQTRRKANACVAEPSIGLTALGATEGAVKPLLEALHWRKQETTVFHANGYGGAAFSRFASRGAFHTIIDLTPHEMTRLHIAGAHTPMPDRFTVAGHLPRIVLPGGLNFIGLGEKSVVPQRFLKRRHYEHSGFFTHAELTPDEMALVAGELSKTLNACTGARTLIVPMGGFSHQDRPGGAIENRELRDVFLSTVRDTLDGGTTLRVLDAHIFDPPVTDEILAALDGFTLHERTDAT